MLARMLAVLAAAAAAVIGVPAAAHEVRPAFLQIREIEPATYDILWKTPAQGDLRLGLNVVWPLRCRTLGVPRITLVAGAAIERRRTTCEGGISGQRIGFENLEASLTDVILRFQPIEGAPRTLRVAGDEPHAVIPARQSMSDVAATYFRLGVEHILFGFDHLLFVLCLLMLVDDRRRLLVAVTAFTIAHSITLAGTTFGWLQLASAPVEACIALSIAFVAAEIVKTRAGRMSTTQRWPWIASFGFGLLHGFGFASALHDIGLPEGAVPQALLFFNLGVEAGQILFVTIVLAIIFLWRRYAPRPPAWAWRVPTYIAGVAGSFWFIERATRSVF